MIIPHGLICAWYGGIPNIPPGWGLCDGSHGTPDLRDQFIIGAGSTYNPHASGGATEHNHTFTTDGHTHLVVAGVGLLAGTNYDLTTSSEVDTGTTANADHIPPFYSLAFIMKI